MPKPAPDFDVALSFAGEDRAYVERVAEQLARMGLRVFYDKHEAVTLWGKDLYAHLREVYVRRARYTVMFISRHYKKKVWPNHERASAQARAFRERREYILPVRFDGTRIPGLLETTGYVPLDGVTPNALAQMIKEKLGPVERPSYFPAVPDLLWDQMRTRTNLQREKAAVVAARLFRSMQLMTIREREIVGTAILQSCREKLPSNVHVEVGYLSRLIRGTRAEIVAALSRIDCLGFTTRLRKPRKYDSHLGEGEQIEISYYSAANLTNQDHDTRVLSAVFRCFEETYCDECTKLAIKKLDWSFLSRDAASPAPHPSRRRSRGAV
jgi:hypothetical protein